MELEMQPFYIFERRYELGFFSFVFKNKIQSVPTDLL